MNYEEVQKEVDGVELPVESWSSENKTIYYIFTGTNSGSSVVNNIEFSATDQNLSTLQGIRIDNNKAIQFEQNAWVNLTSKNASSTIGVFSNYGSLTVDKSLFVNIDASRTSQGNYAAAIYGISSDITVNGNLNLTVSYDDENFGATADVYGITANAGTLTANGSTSITIDNADYVKHVQAINVYSGTSGRAKLSFEKGLNIEVSSVISDFVHGIVASGSDITSNAKSTIKLSDIQGANGPSPNAFGIEAYNESWLTFNKGLDVTVESYNGEGKVYGIYLGGIATVFEAKNNSQITIDGVGNAQSAQALHVTEEAYANFEGTLEIDVSNTKSDAAGISLKNASANFENISITGENNSDFTALDLRDGRLKGGSAIITALPGEQSDTEKQSGKFIGLSIAYAEDNNRKFAAQFSGLLQMEIDGMDDAWGISSNQAIELEKGASLEFSNTRKADGISLTQTQKESLIGATDISMINVGDGDAVSLNGTKAKFTDVLSIDMSGDAVGADGIVLNNGAQALFEGNVAIDGFGLYGVYVDSESKASYKQLGIRDESGLKNGAFNNVALSVSGRSSVTAETAVINPGNWTQYEGKFAQAQSSENLVSTIAIRSSAGSNVSVSKQAVIHGAIIAGIGETTTDENGGSIEITGSESVIVGDVFAANRGTVKLDLTGSTLQGQLDDYHDLKAVNGQSSYRSATFVDDNLGRKLLAAQAGKIDLTLNNSRWKAQGKSFVNSISFVDQNNVVDLVDGNASSLVVGTLKGSDAVLRMELGNANKTDENGSVFSDMLYVAKLDPASQNKIEVVLAENVESLTDLDGLRFATTNRVDSTKHFELSNLKLQITDQGFYDGNLGIRLEDYRVDDPNNAKFNATGLGQGTFKPGEDVVDALFAGGTNWVISSKGNNPGMTLSDAGKAMVAAARGNYWSAVEMDRLVSRLGDARHAAGATEGIWIRVRHSHHETDTGIGDFKSDATTYQIGFDHARALDSGRQLLGFAFDYMDTDAEYRGVSGEGKNDRLGAMLYATWLADNGAYIDLVGRWGRLDNEFNIVNGSGSRVEGDYDNDVWAASVEIGHKLGDDSGFFLEPSAQLQYAWVTDGQYVTNQNTRIDADDIHSLIGRIGARVGSTFGQQANHSVYAKMDFMREFAGEQNIHVKDATVSFGRQTFDIQNKGNWFDVGLGFQSQLGENSYAFADAEYRFGGDLDKSWLINLGLRYAF